MVEIINKKQYFNEKKKIVSLITDLFENDSDVIANIEELTKHLDFIFSLENNKAFLLLDIVDEKLLCMVNFLEYNSIKKEWCLFSVFTKKSERKKSLGKIIIREGIKEVIKEEGTLIVAGIKEINTASRKLHSSMGFTYEGKNWDEVADGFPEDHLAYTYKIERK